MKLTISLIVFIFSTSVLAGFSKGNGGNILSCTDRPNVVLDYFEMGELFKLTPATDLDDPAFFDKIPERLQKVKPDWVNEYLEEVKTLDSKIRFLQSPLESVNDAYVVLIPTNCEMAQTAIQLNGRILINIPLYASLSSSQQKILLLHEVLYAMTLKRVKLDDSRPVRKLVGLLISNEILTLSPIALKRFLNDNL